MRLCDTNIQILITMVTYCVIMTVLFCPINGLDALRSFEPVFNLKKLEFDLSMTIYKGQ